MVAAGGADLRGYQALRHDTVGLAVGWAGQAHPDVLRPFGTAAATRLTTSVFALKPDLRALSARVPSAGSRPICRAKVRPS